MTTAHRPTWKAAVGQSNEGGWTAGGAVSHQTSALDAPAHTKLKFRTNITDRPAALQASLLALQEAEQQQMTVEKLGKRPIDPRVEALSKQKLLTNHANNNNKDVAHIAQQYDDSDAVEEDGSSDESDLDNDDDSDLESNSSDDDDEDDEAALQAELAKIRAEREAAKEQPPPTTNDTEAAQWNEAAIVGNPLLHTHNNNKLKRKWNDDVVFRNQARSEPNQNNKKKRFINDTIRNSFHRRFLNKFMR